MGFLSNSYVLEDIFRFLNSEDMDIMVTVSSRTKNIVNKIKNRPRKRSMRLMYISNETVETYNPLWSLKKENCFDGSSSCFPLKALKLAPKLDSSETIVLDGLAFGEQDAKEFANLLRSRIKAQKIYFTPTNMRRGSTPEFSLLDFLKPKIIVVKNFLEEEDYVKTSMEQLKKEVGDVQVMRLEKYYTWSQMIRAELKYACWYYSNPKQFIVHVRLWKPF